MSEERRSLITFLDKQVRKIHDRNKIIEQIEGFYTDLYDSEHGTIIHTDPNVVRQLTSGMWKQQH